jgi:biotin carboxylase
MRKDFNVFEGYRPKQMAVLKRKSGMKGIFKAAGLKVAPGILPKTLDEALQFAKEIGYPLIMKPDIGVGAEGAKKINDEADLTKNWDPKGNLFIEQFIQGNIETYDGLCDHTGRIVFYSSMQYSAPIMEVLTGQCESIFYYILKDIQEDLKQVGDIAVKACDVKNRFFHCEFFRTADGSLLPLEMNLRPPGGITVDMWNYTHRMDLYSEYANVITRQPASPYIKPTHYGTYTARRDGWKYLHTHEEVLALLGKRLELIYAMPSIFSAVMGNFAYVFTSVDFELMQEAVKYIEARAH